MTTLSVTTSSTATVGAWVEQDGGWHAIVAVSTGWASRTLTIQVSPTTSNAMTAVDVQDNNITFTANGYKLVALPDDFKVRTSITATTATAGNVTTTIHQGVAMTEGKSRHN